MLRRRVKQDVHGPTSLRAVVLGASNWPSGGAGEELSVPRSESRPAGRSCRAGPPSRIAQGPSAVDPRR
jgi:hypothetical protein